MRVYNTATRSKQELKPISDKEVGIYSCGPTVYGDQHIGNMYAFIVWDTLVRILRYLDYKVTWVMNITDVGHMTSDQDTGEDKMEKGARREGVSPKIVARKYEAQFLDSVDKLNIQRPDVLPRAMEHIKEQIELALKMEERGFTYRTKTGLVFDTAKFPDYAKFARLKLEEMEAGARVEVDEEKKHPWDFLLWVTNQPKHIMKWDSPWGEGFPGWHLECTAMSTKYLGDKFDIHTGGIEHIGVHHTNEIAQAYGAFGHNTANYWMHNAWLTLKNGKMSKSAGTAYTVQQLEKIGFDPLALRYLVLSSHYRKGLVFSLESLGAAQIGLENLKAAVRRWQDQGEGRISGDFKKEFVENISDDLAMPEAMAVIWRLVKSDLPAADKLATILDFDRVLGLGLEKVEKIEVPAEVEKLAHEREAARNQKNWAEADRLREEIENRGYIVEDSAQGFRLKLKK